MLYLDLATVNQVSSLIVHLMGGQFARQVAYLHTESWKSPFSVKLATLNVSMVPFSVPIDRGAQ